MRVLRLLLFLCLASCAVPQRTAVYEDFSSWEEIGGPVWQIEGTETTAGPAETVAYLVSDEQYGDLRLSVEFRIDDETNSGVFVRCSDTSSIAGINPETCYEINIWDNHPNQMYRSGSVVTLTPPDEIVNTLRQWNTYDITVKGSSIEVILNGVRTAAIENDRLASGKIALQYTGGGQVQFRNLQISPL